MKQAAAVASQHQSGEPTFDFLLRQAMHAVLTQRRFAEAAEVEAGEPLSLCWEWDLGLLLPLGRDPAGLGMSAVAVWSASSSTASIISSEMRRNRGCQQPVI